MGFVFPLAPGDGPFYGAAFNHDVNEY